MNQWHGEVIGGIGGVVLGGWMVYASLRPILPSALKVWWLDDDSPNRNFIERGLASTVGIGFILLGIGMTCEGISRLLRLR